MNTADLERVSTSQEEAQAFVDEKLQSKSKISKILKKIGIPGRVSISIENSSSWGTIKHRALTIKESSLTYFQDPLLIHFLLFILFCSIATIFILGIMFLMYR